MSMRRTTRRAKRLALHLRLCSAGDQAVARYKTPIPAEAERTVFEADSGYKGGEYAWSTLEVRLASKRR